MATYNEYEDKEALIENPSIPDINKVKANDMNYIKYNLPHIGTSVDSSYNTNLIKGKNLFDKNGANILNDLFVSSSENKVEGYPGTKSIYIPIKSNTTYTISKSKGHTFRIGTSSVIPVLNTPLSDVVRDNTASEITITSSSSAKYLMVYIYVSGDTDSFNDIIATLQIEEGNEATTYEAFVPNSIVVEGENFTETIGVGTSVNSANRVNFIKSRNLYNKSTDLTNTIVSTDGSLTTTEGYVASQLIPVKPSSTYSISYVNTSASEKIMRIGYYQQNGTPITRTTMSENSTITTQANCYYIRVSYYLSTNHSVQVEEGTSATTYVPFSRSIVVDNDEIYNQNIMNYSTSEIRIGTWIDGKPLYRKVYKTTTPSATASTQSVITLSNQNIVKIEGLFSLSSTQKIPINFYDGTNYLFTYQSSSTALSMKTNYTNGLNKDVYITLEYTKTTD